MDRLNAWNRLPDGGRLLVENPQAADLDIPLTNSIIPRRWVGSVTYTRSGIATVTDHEWVVRTVNSGEARFLGARRVQNMLWYSQDFTNAAWTKINSSVSFDTITWPAWITGRVSKIVESAALTQHGISTWASISNLQWNTYISSIYAKAWNRNFIQLLTSGSVWVQYANFNLTNGTFSESSAWVGAIVSVGNGWYRCSIKYTSTSTNIALAYCMIGTSLSDTRYFWYTGDGTSFVYIQAFQHEDVTGQSVQTAGEYVSTNVLTATPYHGANVDWVKYFDTTLTGTQLTPKWYHSEGASTNLFTYSNTFSSWSKSVATMTITPNQGTWLDGTNSLWKIATGTSTWLQWIILGATVTAAIHTYTVYAKAGENSILQLLTQWTLSSWYVNFDLSDGTVGSSSLWTGSITPVAWFPWIYKCVAITNALVAGTGNFYISQVPTKTTGRAGNMVGDWVSGLYVWWAQLELWSMSTSHLFTTGSTVTRNDDILSYNVNNFNNVYGGVYAEVFTDWTGTVTSNVLQYPRIFGSSWWSLLYLGGTNALTNHDGGTAVSGMDITAGSTVQKVWLTYSATRNFFCNWVADTGKAYDGDMSITGLLIGNSSGGTRALYGNIRNVKIWKTPPTVAELTSITSQ